VTTNPLEGGMHAAVAPQHAAIFARLALREGALSIAPEKTDFFAARLGRRLTALGINDFGAYAAHLQSQAGFDEIRHFIEALTTHTTSFFREVHQFDWLRDSGLPEMMLRGCGQQRELVAWSAACSTGQELFSTLMTLASAQDAEETGLRFRGIGTDLSKAVLQTAKQAIYSGEEIAGIPEAMRRRYLLSARDGADQHRIAAVLRQRARWAQANLVHAQDLAWIDADLVLLRNVLIYFDAQTRDRALANVIGRIRPGGYLLTGHAETLRAAQYGLVAIRPSIYRKTG